MKRRTFLKVFGIGGAVVGSGAISAVGMPLTPEEDFIRRYKQVSHDIVNDILHPLDGVIMLKELRDENIELFKSTILKDKKVKTIAKRCGRYLFDTNEREVYRMIMERRERLPLRSRRKPNYGKRYFKS